MRKRSLVPSTVLAIAIASTGAHARPFVIPHMLETAGTASTTLHAWDTSLYVFYATAIGPVDTGPGATVDVYLFDNSGMPLQSALATNVCDPCSFSMTASNRKEEIVFDTLIANAGGGSYPLALTSGWALVEVSGDVDAVGLEAWSLNSVTGPADIRIDPRPLLEVAKGSGNAAPTAWVLPHAIDNVGSILTTTNSFDTSVHFTYASGRGSLPAGSGATVDVYLYDQDTEDLLRNDAADPICAPCAVSLDSSTPKVSVDLEQWIRDGNGGNYTATPFHRVSLVALVSGDADGVAIAGETINALTGPTDLRVIPLEPMAIDVTLVPTSVAEGFPLGLMLQSYPNPTAAGSTLRFEAPRAGSGTLEVFDLRGRRVVTLLSGEIPAGPQSVTWDGRDAQGVHVAPGIYLVRLQRGPWFRQQKIAITR